MVIPLQWKNETVVCVASGPSLLKEDVEYCRGRAKIAVVNDNYKLIDADLLYAADLQWWDYHNGVPEFTGQKWTQDEKAAKKYNLNHVAGKWQPGISHSSDFIHYGFNSGFQLVNLVYLMGARKIILLGFDMKFNKKSHWFGDHPEPLNRPADYHKWAKIMDKAARRYEKAGVEVINCSRDTGLTEYKRALIHDCL